MSDTKKKKAAPPVGKSLPEGMIGTKEAAKEIEDRASRAARLVALEARHEQR
jgi:hypothetical protein